MKRKEFTAEGTTCQSCAEIITRSILKIDGVKEVEFDYATEKGSVTYNPKHTNMKEILKAVKKAGYDGYTSEDKKPKDTFNTILNWTIGILGVVIVVYFIMNYVDGIQLPQISHEMGYGLLFLVGLLTGFHCVSMCGGFVVSYTAKAAQEGKKSYTSHLRYGFGKLISYTLIGAAFGLLGSIIAFTPMMRGVAGLLAGLFLVLFGLKMLNIIPALRKIQFKTPQFISKFVGKESRKSSSPLVIGLLNGLMIACGPLQAIYVLAAGTGSVIEGAKLLFVFGLGTLPVMIGFGYFASFVSNKVTHKILKASGTIVIILGLLMINNGLTLAGTGYDFNSIVTTFSGTEDITGNAELSDSMATTNNGYQEIRMEVNRYGWSPDKFVLKKGVPVKWIIQGKEINGCNNAIQVPKLGLEFDIKKGEQVIEFTPEKEGVIPWSCWMGMIPGTFIVKEDIDLNNQEEIKKELANVPQQPKGSCGGSCGSPSCGSGGCGCGGR